MSGIQPSLIKYEDIARQEDTGRPFGLILAGPPGIGKTYAAMGMRRPEDAFCRIAVAGKNKEDFATYPVPAFDEEIKEFIIHQPITEDTIRPLLDKNIGDGYGILLLDDMTAADPSLQSAALELVQFGRIGKHQLGKNVFVVMTGNMSSDGAYAVKWSTALLGRSHFIEYKPNFELWESLPINKNNDPIIMGFLKANEQFFSPDRNAENSDKFFDENDCGPSPRLWTTLASSLMAKYNGLQNFRPNILFPSASAYCSSLIGQNANTALMTFANEMLNYPSAEAILENPSIWRELPQTLRNQKGAVYAVAHSLRHLVVKRSEKLDEIHGLGSESVKAIDAKRALCKQFAYATAELMRQDNEMGAYCVRYMLQNTHADDTLGGVFTEFAYDLNGSDPVLRDAGFDRIMENIRMMGQSMTR